MSEITLRLIFSFIADVFLAMFLVYSWKSLLKNDSDNIDTPNVISIIAVAFLLNITSYMFPQPWRVFAIFFVLTVACNAMLNNSLTKSIKVIVISQALIWISEFILSIAYQLISNGKPFINLEKPIPFLIFNIFLIIISYGIFKTKIPTKIYKQISKSEKYKNGRNLNIGYFIGIIIIMIISLIESYMNIPFVIVSITNIIMTIFFIFLIFKMSNVEDKYNNVNKKYRTSINGLREYEEMMDKYRVVNHENKNTLLEIRGMLAHEDSKDKIIKMIDNTIDNKIKDNEKIMHKTVKIPEGGLRGIIYSKICVMDDLKIKYKLDIANDVRTVDLINLDDDVIVNICKILGVFIDNSIEEVRNLKKKNIGIEIYVIDDTLSIDISNNYKGNIDMDKIDNAGYTTKGKGHGYGLALVNKILEENKDILENERMIEKNTFTQCLKIKLKQE